MMNLSVLPRLDGRNKTPKRSFAVITIDCWVKFMAPETGKHPIMNEDNWDEDDLHCQLYEGIFGKTQATPTTALCHRGSF